MKVPQTIMTLSKYIRDTRHYDMHTGGVRHYDKGVSRMNKSDYGLVMERIRIVWAGFTNKIKLN